MTPAAMEMAKATVYVRMTAAYVSILKFVETDHRSNMYTTEINEHYID